MLQDSPVSEGGPGGERVKPVIHSQQEDFRVFR